MIVEAKVNQGRLAMTVEIARTGSEVLIVDNLATASLANPEREGEQWAEMQMKRLASVGSRETIVIIGIASAFHIRSLRDLIKQKIPAFNGEIVAIDTCVHSFDFAKTRVSGATFLMADSITSIDQFIATPEISKWVSQTFTLLKHKPTISRTGEKLRRLESWIIGRTPEAFAAQLRQRPEIAAGLNPARTKKIAEVSLVSIRDLSKMWDISSELKSDRRIFRVLEELVR